jgi:probable F420-dependent oxidoreductase
MRHGIVQFTSDRGLPPAVVGPAAERAGFGSFWVPEHTHIPVRRDAAHPGTGTAELPDDRYMRTLDPWVALATVVPLTERIRLGTAVALPVEHDPISLAKTIATLDHLSGGRVTLGAGFAWNTDELEDHNVPPKKRRTMLREYLEAMRALWSEEEAAYDGEFVTFGPSWSWPKTVQPRGVPALIGAAGTDKNFAWIVRSAHGWISTPMEPDIDAKVARLRELWTEAGRDGGPEVVILAGKPDADQLAGWETAGVTEVLFGIPDKYQSADEVAAYLGRLAGKIGLPPSAD